jgi:hypothetical protein
LGKAISFPAKPINCAAKQKQGNRDGGMWAHSQAAAPAAKHHARAVLVAHNKIALDRRARLDGFQICVCFDVVNFSRARGPLDLSLNPLGIPKIVMNTRSSAALRQEDIAVT